MPAELTRIAGIAMMMIIIIIVAQQVQSHYPHPSEIYWRDNKLISTAQLIIIESRDLIYFASHGALINVTVTVDKLEFLLIY